MSDVGIGPLLGSLSLLYIWNSPGTVHFTTKNVFPLSFSILATNSAFGVGTKEKLATTSPKINKPILLMPQKYKKAPRYHCQ